MNFETIEYDCESLSILFYDDVFKKYDVVCDCFTSQRDCDTFFKFRNHKEKTRNFSCSSVLSITGDGFSQHIKVYER